MSVMNRFSLRKNQRGDTIVEVLISIAVVSMILGGAYVTTNNSLRATRAAEERTAALKLVQGQLEFVKSMMSSDAGYAALQSAPQNFCIVANTIATAQPSTPASSTAACQVGADGQPASADPKYKLSISKVGNNFTILSTWDSIANTGQDSIQMSYRAYH